MVSDVRRWVFSAYEILRRLIFLPPPAAQCPVLSSPINGRVAVASPAVYQSQATFTCNPGYTLVGTSTLICTASGAWDAQPPTCRRKRSFQSFPNLPQLPLLFSKELTKAIRQQLLSHLAISLSNSVGTTFSCFVLHVEISKSQATHSPDTDLPDMILYIRVSTFCNALTNRRNRRKKHRGPDHGQIFLLSCQLTCHLQDLQWKYRAVSPVCKPTTDVCVLLCSSCVPSLSLVYFSAIVCTDPGTPDNGGRNATSLTLNSVIQYYCNPGYEMQGSATVTCQASGSFTGTAPTCRGLFIKTPVLPSSSISAFIYCSRRVSVHSTIFNNHPHH